MNALHRHSLMALTLAVMIPSFAFAQAALSSNYTSFDATSEKPVQLGYYASAHTSTGSPAPSPEVRVVQAPKSGLVIVRRGELTTNKIPACPGLKTAVQVVFYEARPETTGHDHLVYTLKSENDEVSTFDVTINIQDRAPRCGLADRRSWKTISGLSRIGQSAAMGRPTMGSSPTGAMLSSVM